MNRRQALHALASLAPMLACGRTSETPPTAASAGSLGEPTPAVPPTDAADVAMPSEGRELLPHPRDPAKKIEWFWKKPPGPGPFPVLVLLHGHQLGERPGGRMFVTAPKFDAVVYDGFVAAAVSQPGYGQSDGPPDFCGPFTQDAVLAVLGELRRRPFVDATRIGLEGASRGAMVAGLVAARDPSLAAIVLISGPYDLIHQYAALAHTRGLGGMRSLMEQETGGASEEALRARSVLAVADKIRTPTLILNGKKDDRTDPAKAVALANELSAYGVAARAVVFPNAGHLIPFADLRKEELPFLKTYLRP